MKGHIKVGGGGKISAKQASWIQSLTAAGIVERRFNSGLFSNGDTREPELAGIRTVRTTGYAIDEQQDA